MNWDSIEHLVISGGGPRVFAFCGVVEQLNRFCYLHTHESLHTKIKSGAGTSIGALVVFAFLSGMGMDELMFISKGARIWKADSIISAIDWIGLTQKSGFCKNSLLIEFVESIFMALNYPFDLTFSQWNEITNRDITINTTCLETNKMELFSTILTPDDTLMDILSMTMCIPVLFQPYEYKNKTYADGGLTCNYLGHLHDPLTSIGILHSKNETDEHVDLPESTKTNAHKSNGGNIIAAILNTLEFASWQLQDEQLKHMNPVMKKHTIKVYPVHIVSYANMFQFTESQMDRLFFYGCAKTVWHFYKNEWMVALTVHCMTGMINQNSAKQKSSHPINKEPSSPTDKEELFEIKKD